MLIFNLSFLIIGGLVDVKLSACHTLSSVCVCVCVYGVKTSIMRGVLCKVKLATSTDRPISPHEIFPLSMPIFITAITPPPHSQRSLKGVRSNMESTLPCTLNFCYQGPLGVVSAAPYILCTQIRFVIQLFGVQFSSRLSSQVLVILLFKATTHHVAELPYSWKIWRGIKFGGLAVCL